MTLADLIQSQINKDIAKLEAQYKAELKETKSNWDNTLSETKKLHSDKIDKTIATQINFHKFQQSKANKFNYGYAIQTQLNAIYEGLIPEILNSKFIQDLIYKTLQDIPANTTLTISGQYSNELEKIIKSLNYKIELDKNDKTLGAITAKLEAGHLEITIEDILNTVKQKTLPTIIQEI